MADNNYTLGLTFDGFHDIAIGSTETQAGTGEVHTFSPAYGLSAVRVQTLTISGSNNLGFAVSADRALPTTLTWDGTTGQILTFIVSANNTTVLASNLTGTVNVETSSYGILSAGVTGSVMNGRSQSLDDTFVALGASCWYTISIPVNTFGTIEYGSTESQAGSAYVSAALPAYGLSSVRLQNITVSASNAIAFVVSADRTLPATLTWNGVNGSLLNFIVSGNNYPIHSTDLSGSLIVTISAYGILSGGNLAVPETESTNSSSVVFVALGDQTAPSGVTGFTATAGQIAVRLNWTNPAESDLSAVRVRYDVGTTAPANTTVGTLLYQGIGTTTEHTGLTANETVAYGIFSLDNVGNWSTLTSNTSATATTFDASVYGLTEQWPYLTDAEIGRILFEEGII